MSAPASKKAKRGSSSSSSSSSSTAAAPDAAAPPNERRFAPEKSSDVRLLYGGCRFHLHSQFLQRHCGFFQALEEPPKEWGDIPVPPMPGVDLDLFQRCLELAYDTHLIDDAVRKAALDELMGMVRLGAFLNFARLTDSSSMALEEKAYTISPHPTTLEEFDRLWRFGRELPMPRVVNGLMEKIASALRSNYEGTRQRLDEVGIWQDIRKNHLEKLLRLVSEHETSDSDSDPE
jgi:hypothetical protein